MIDSKSIETSRKIRYSSSGSNRLIVIVKVMMMNMNMNMKLLFITMIVMIQLFGQCISFKPYHNNQYTRSTFLRMAFMTHYEELPVKTNTGTSLVDITQQVADIVKTCGCKEGVVTVLSKHSTVGIIIQEWEPRFVDDARQFLLKLAPPNYPWLHNDNDYRVGPSDWPGGDTAWRAFRATQTPNAHSHIIAMLCGTSESIPIHNSALSIGKYQNIIVVDADGPKEKRTIIVQVMGDK